MLRWSLRLAEFQFSIEHRPGASIKHVDALSRAVRIVAAGDPVTQETIKMEQARDTGTVIVYSNVLLGNEMK